jgi:predicted nucleic acid-binding protein
MKNMESRILVDTNILLDYLMKREPFYPYAKEFGAEYIVTRNTDDKTNTP